MSDDDRELRSWRTLGSIAMRMSAEHRDPECPCPACDDWGIIAQMIALIEDGAYPAPVSG